MRKDDYIPQRQKRNNVCFVLNIIVLFFAIPIPEDAWIMQILILRIDQNRFFIVDDNVFADDAFLESARWNIVHDFQHRVLQMERNPRAPDFLSMDSLATERKAPSVNFR